MITHASTTEKFCVVGGAVLCLLATLVYILTDSGSDLGLGAFIASLIGLGMVFNAIRLQRVRLKEARRR